MQQFQKCLMCILVLINGLIDVMCFNVEFRPVHNVHVEPFHTQVYKREMAQFFDKAAFSLKGFEKIESIPVLFPIDICVLNVEGTKYATALHMSPDAVRHFVVLKMNNGSYELIADLPTPNAIAMDCIGFGTKGYAAVVYNFSQPVEYAREGSPIFQIAGDRVRAVQFFAATNLEATYLRASGNELFLLQAFANTRDTPNLYCPFFKWSGSSFNILGRIPCSNARHVEPFSIDYESFVAVANYADQRGRTDTKSEIYKYVQERGRFELFQKIPTNGAVDVQYFSVPHDEIRRQHFLVFANSMSYQRANATEDGKTLEADSVIYTFDRGQFVPYQRLTFYAVRKFLPVENEDAEKFLLLVASAEQDIKIYNLNDWKFEESSVQFTEGALGKGVANMRIYNENDNSYLVIANELMTDNETNIFLPIFEQNEHVNSLRQEIIDWSTANMQRLRELDVETIQRQVEEKLGRLEHTRYLTDVQDIADSNIHTVLTRSLIYPTLKMNGNYWKALSYTKQALDTLEAEVSVKQRAKREINSQETLESTEYEFDSATIGTLRIHNRLKAKRVNGIDPQEPHFRKIQAKQIAITGNYTTPTSSAAAPQTLISAPAAAEGVLSESGSLSVRNLQITGKLNGLSWNELLNNTLKKREERQFLKARANIKELQAPSVLVTNDEINAQSLHKLVLINGSDYVINQDLQFTAPITAKDIVINERLNNIHVFQGNFDVLLKRSNESQIIKGPKRLENLRVLEPITVAGQLLGKHLQSISPKKAIHEPLLLNGDFIINGNVSIGRLLRTEDLFDVVHNKSTRQTLEQGIRMDRPLTNVNLRFKRPLQVNDSLLSFANTQDLQRLVRLNLDEIQVIEGPKTFRHSLEVKQGFSAVRYLNGIDVEELEKRLLLKHTNQTITVPMHFGQILAKGVKASMISLNNNNLSEYLTRSEDQHIRGTLTVGRLKVNTLELGNLNTNDKIFNKRLPEIYEQKAKSAPTEDIFRMKSKFHGSIYVRNLRLNATINGRPVQDIERQLTQLEGNIKYVGNFKFNYDMNVTDLVFGGRLNGIEADEFGRCWLQKAGNQEFSTPQSLASVQCERGVHLRGKLNSFSIEDFSSNVYWINRNEQMADVVFVSPIEMGGSLKTESLNHISFPNDMLYQRFPNSQVITGPTIIEGDLKVNGYILNTSTVNSLNLMALQRFLKGYDYDTLHMESANFISGAPFYRSINQHNLQKTLDSVWLANENVVLQYHVEIFEARIEGLLESEGPINNMNMKYLRENYFSLTQPQEISTPLVFGDNVRFENQVQTNYVNTFGAIIESKSNKHFNFNKFVSSALKRTGAHEISGKWSIVEASIQGDLHNVLVNDLNLINDVLTRNKASHPFEMTAPKVVKSATIHKLYAAPKSTLNKVDVTNWIRNTVFLSENHTIRGVTTLDSVNIYNDLRISGLVNNISFNHHTLLLRDRNQSLNGHVRICTRIVEGQRFLTNNIENLEAESINGHNVDQFYASRAQVAPAVHLKSHLLFKQPLLLEEYHGPHRPVVQVQATWHKRDIDRMLRTNASSVEVDEGEVSMETLRQMEKDVNYLITSFSEQHSMIDHFEIGQVLPINGSKVIHLTVKLAAIPEDVFAVTNQSEKIANFYRWDTNLHQFVEYNEFYGLLRNLTYIDAIKLALENVDSILVSNPHYLTDLEENPIYEIHGLKEILRYKTLNGSKVEHFQMFDEHCLALFGDDFFNSSQLHLYCIQQSNGNSSLVVYRKDIIHRKHVEQISVVSNESIALLFKDCVEIWNTNSNLEMQQRLPSLHSTSITAGHWQGTVYLAITSERKVNSLHHGAVEIYRSVSGSNFQHFQSLDCTEPQQVAFSILNASNTFLLYVRTTTNDKPLLVYQHQGVMGFNSILSISTLPLATDMKLINPPGSQQHFVALIGRDNITFVEIVQKEY